MPGLDCCSDVSVAFHYMDPHMMYFMEYMLYCFQLNSVDLNKKIKDQDLNRLPQKELIHPFWIKLWNRTSKSSTNTSPVLHSV